jgi:hypothetical protein
MRSPTTAENALLILAFKQYHRNSNHHVPFSQALVESHVRDGGTAKAKGKSQAVEPTARNVDGLIAVGSASAWEVSGVQCATSTGATYTADSKPPATPTILFSPSSFRADAIYASDNKSRTMAAVSGTRSSCRSRRRADNIIDIGTQWNPLTAPRNFNNPQAVHSFGYFEGFNTGRRTGHAAGWNACLAHHKVDLAEYLRLQQFARDVVLAHLTLDADRVNELVGAYAMDRVHRRTGHP